MRFLDKTGCTAAFEHGKNTEITSMGDLTKEACKIAENKKLALLKTRLGYYRVIRECGLGMYEDFFSDLGAVDCFLKSL